jgi:hypothetical protein
MPTQAERTDALEATVKNLEEFRNKILWTGAVAKALWIIGGLSLAALLTGAYNQVWSYAGLTKDVQAHTREIDRLQEQIKELRADNNRLREHVIVIFDRDPKGPPRAINAIVYRGRLLQVSATNVTILDPDPGEPARRFPLAKDAAFTIGGKTAKLGDLEVGMNAEMLFNGGEVQWIHADKN